MPNFLGQLQRVAGAYCAHLFLQHRCLGGGPRPERRSGPGRAGGAKVLPGGQLQVPAAAEGGLLQAKQDGPVPQRKGRFGLVFVA